MHTLKTDFNFFGKTIFRKGCDNLPHLSVLSVRRCICAGVVLDEGNCEQPHKVSENAFVIVGEACMKKHVQRIRQGFFRVSSKIMFQSSISAVIV